MHGKRKPRRVLRFAVSGALLVGASSMAACGDDDYDGPTINEPYEEPTPNTPPVPPEERIPAETSSNEPAPEREPVEAEAETEAEAEAEAE